MWRRYDDNCKNTTIRLSSDLNITIYDNIDILPVPSQDPSFFVYLHRVDIDITHMLTHISPPSLHTTHADDQKLGQLKLHERESSVYLLRSGKGQSQSWHPLPVPKIYKKPLLIISQHCWKYSMVSGDKGCPNYYTLNGKWACTSGKALYVNEDEMYLAHPLFNGWHPLIACSQQMTGLSSIPVANLSVSPHLTLLHECPVGIQLLGGLQVVTSISPQQRLVCCDQCHTCIGKSEGVGGGVGGYVGGWGYGRVEEGEGVQRGYEPGLLHFWPLTFLTWSMFSQLYWLNALLLWPSWKHEISVLQPSLGRRLLLLLPVSITSSHLCCLCFSVPILNL